MLKPGPQGGKTMTRKEERRITAVHELGHAWVALSLLERRVRVVLDDEDSRCEYDPRGVDMGHWAIIAAAGLAAELLWGVPLREAAVVMRVSD